MAVLSLEVMLAAMLAMVDTAVTGLGSGTAPAASAINSGQLYPSLALATYALCFAPPGESRGLWHVWLSLGL